MSEIEVRGVPIRVFDSAMPTMRSIWELAQLRGDQPYVVFEDERYTYAEIGAQVRALAALLRERTVSGRATGWRWRCATIPNGSSPTGPRSRSAPPWWA